MKRKLKILGWEMASVLWIVLGGAVLHFAFELSDYWTPMALMAAVNESIWEHLKMYFWPGLVWALGQYTYTRHIANNYWLGKAAALAITPVSIIIMYQAYFAYANAVGMTPTLWAMLAIMFAGIILAQLTSYAILSMEPLSQRTLRLAPAGMLSLLFMFSTFTYFPPKVFLFENFACYTYTGEYGILDDYEPYRVFVKVDENGVKDGGGLFYCDNKNKDLDAIVADAGA